MPSRLPGASLSESIDVHRDPGAEHAELLHATGVVVFGFISFQIGVAAAAWLASFLGRAISWASGFANGYLGWPVEEPPASPVLLGTDAVTWLLLVAVILGATSRFAIPRLRRITVVALTLLIAATQLLRLASPLWLSPWERYSDVFRGDDSSTHWILAYVYLPMHRIWLICCVAALPFIAWYVIAREARRSRAVLANARRPRASRHWLVVPPSADSWRITWLFLAAMVALFVGSSVARLFSSADQTRWQFSTARILWTVVLELALIAFWLPQLRRRGWTLAMTTRDLQWVDALRGMGLLVVALVVARVTHLFVFIVHRPLAILVLRHHSAGPLSWWAIPPLVLINPAFEEVSTSVSPRTRCVSGGEMARPSGALLRFDASFTATRDPWCSRAFSPLRCSLLGTTSRRSACGR